MRVGKLTEIVEWMFPGAEGSGELVFNGYTEFLFGLMTKFWAWVVVMAEPHFECA